MTTHRSTIRYSAFAITAPGLSGFAAGELTALGVRVGEVDGAGVAFEADARTLARANMRLRTVSRILVRIDEFRAATFHELQKRAARIEWGRWIAPGREVTVRVTCRKSRLYHSGAVAQRVAERLAPIAGRVVSGAGDTAADSGDEPNDVADAQLLVVRLVNDRCTISLDSSGALLHQRGYRLASGKAPLRETLGSALLLASGWVPGEPLVDPFCGSGTLAIEGAMMARRIAPGRRRHFAMERWPAIDREIVDQVRAEALDGELSAAGAPIFASDRDAGAIAAARSNAERAGVASDIRFAVQPVSALQLPDGTTTAGALVTNPPYGVRVSHGGELRNLYARAGVVLRSVCPGWRLALVAADRRLVGQLGIPLTDAVRTTNGGIAVTFAVGEIPALP